MLISLSVSFMVLRSNTRPVAISAKNANQLDLSVQLRHNVVGYLGCSKL